MGLFRRRPKGRHALGAAVTSLPSGPATAAAPEAPQPAAAPAPDLPMPPAAAPPTAPAMAPAPELPEAPAVRVQLGFRDGTSASLDPGSSQARALQELADSLTRLG